MKMSVRRSLGLVVCLGVAGLAAFGAGCGGDSTTATTAVPPAATATSVADTDAGGILAIKGAVDDPKSLSLDDLRAMTQTTITAEHPKTGAGEYTGVLIGDIMAAVGAQPGATILDIGASDGYMGEVILSDLDPECMIAIAADGALSAVMPGQAGKAWVKNVVTLDFK